MGQPNIVVIMVDDMRRDDLAVMPQTRKYLGTDNGSSPPNGVRYSRAYAANPLCTPNRSCHLVGQYAHNTGVWGNDPLEGQGINALHPLEEDTLPVWLQAAGYRTGFVGKYVNGYGENGDTEPDTYVPPGWDEWRATQSGTYSYNGTRTVNVNGTLQQDNGYVTTWARKKAVGRINDWAPDDVPFYLQVCFVAPHNDHPAAEPQYAGDSTIGVPESDAFDQAMPDDVPWIADGTAYTQSDIRRLTATRRERRDCLKSVDDAVNEIRLALVDNGVMNDTLIFFLSDNGFMLGEHRVENKQKPYEESTGVPVLARWTNGPLNPGVQSRLVSTIDVTATIVDVADAIPGHPLDGRSLLEPMPPTGEYRPVLSEGRQLSGDMPSWKLLRVRDYAYVEYEDSEIREFYDLAAQPWQRTNQISDPAYAGIVASLADLMVAMKDGAGVDYDVNWTPPA
jgi:N-acetylglucosamine-6-sulfatase